MGKQSQSILCSEMGPSLGLATLLVLALTSTTALPHQQLGAKVARKMVSGLMSVWRVSEEPIQHLGGVRL